MVTCTCKNQGESSSNFNTADILDILLPSCYIYIPTYKFDTTKHVKSSCQHTFGLVSGNGSIDSEDKDTIFCHVCVLALN